MYSRNLEDLSNRQIVKVKDKDENNRISDFFAKITYIAMLQAGVNKSKYNFLSLTDFGKFIDIMNDETAQFLNAPNKTQLLVDFKNKFEQVNSQVNRDRTRFKNYLTAVNVQQIISKSATGLSSITPKVNIINYRTMDEKSKKDAMAGVKEAQKRWLEEEIAEFYEAVEQYNKGLDTFSSKGVNKGKATIDDVIDETLGIFRTVQMFPEFSNLIMPYLTDIQTALNSFGRKEGYDIYKAKKTAKNQAQEMTFENLFEVVDKFISAQNESNITSENLVERKNLIPTTNPNVLVYNDLSGTEKAYKYITENNQDVTFVYQFSLGQKQTFESMTDAEFNKKKLTGQVQLKKLANSSSIGMITGQNSVADSFSKTDSKYYKGIKTEIEKTINAINEVIQNGGKIAFSMNGYGDPALMPEELFVYLSRRLFEEFQYLNPGSEFAQEVSDEVAMYQTITDTEILAKFEGENNPLKC
jgi:hypothetical protein